MDNKRCGYGRHFRWSKRYEGSGIYTYRLWRKDHAGKWHRRVLSINRILSDGICDGAWLRQQHHQLREQVDALQLEAWGIT